MLLRKGKVKEVHSTDDGNLQFLFTDNISVFDKVIPNQIPKKGEVLCRASTFWLKETERLGIATHFIEQTSPNTMKVRKMEVITDYSKITKETENYVVPLEFIARYYLAGSLYDMIAADPKTVNPAGEWNTIVIRVQNGNVTHTQNGVKVVEYTLWTPEWDDLVANSKFKRFPGFTEGISKDGYIGLQDHGYAVWFRNIKIRKL